MILVDSELTTEFDDQEKIGDFCYRAFKEWFKSFNDATGFWQLYCYY